MNTFKSTEQIFWANNLNVNEVVPWEIENLCNLLNAIFSEAVGHEVDKLRQEMCCGCKVNHPSQRRHECLILSEEEGWIMHGLEAIERIIKHEIVWKQFAEGFRVIMKLNYREYATEHFKNLTKNYEATQEFLKDLKFNSSFPEYKAIMGHLSYWSDDNLYVTFCQKPSC